MSNSFLELLTLLADGKFHSGSAMGSSLGVSCTTVWKYVQKLLVQGISIESVKGKGYRLVGGLQLLDESLIRSGVKDDVIADLGAIDVLMETDSTNDVAMSYDALALSKGYVCLAEYQKAGRGRRGRHWVSPIGHNIYMSLAWQFEQSITGLESLSLSVGVIVAEVLENIGLEGVQLKWPNDILLHGRKLGGILLEMSGNPSEVCKVVIGIGINVRMLNEVSIDQPWACIEEAVAPISRNQLVACLINQMVEMLRQFHNKGFAFYKDNWEKYDAYYGAFIVVTSGNNRQEGIAQGVFDNGALRLQVGGTELTIYDGEVSIRLKHAS
ncbi:biotin--[acetyl-CoA-carboxylase] ligase [Candidatus Endobugula sertula]|uniref:Bifunctional ligase/repressor BirA n=1 Tax=Candidatus Endobugula sertula TaxID=62101 RepID=A0A1D2QLB0_9GAMM|nr:biotin--[acetyl-CoA-carboxylase] ligase [Candidatus Endobugula sertula]